MPNTEPSPRPWRVGDNSLGWKSCIEDADGKQIASCWGGDGVNCTEPAQSDAALIMDAANERDRLAADEARYRTDNVVLRDIVRRFVDLFTPETIRPAGTMERLLREARAAIGEGAR